MLYPYLVAMGVMVVLTSLWVTVQMARRRSFPEAAPEEDLLHGRAGCGYCPRGEDCHAASEQGASLWRER